MGLTAMPAPASAGDGSGAAGGMHPLPAPGEVVHVDHRPQGAPTGSSNNSTPLKLVQWNIERGYCLEAIIEQLRGLDADVLALQEVGVAGWVGRWQCTLSA